MPRPPRLSIGRLSRTLHEDIPARATAPTPTWTSRGAMVPLVLLLLGVGNGLWAPRLAAQQAPVKGPPAATDEQPAAQDWKPLFDGASLAGWEVTPFGGHGEVDVEDGVIVLGMGSPLTGITYQRDFPRCDYEVQVEAMRIDGVDFFSTITFPVQDAFCSLVVGGWGGAVVGISSLDYADASENETTKFMRFEPKRWYRIRVAVRSDRIEAWIDDRQVVDVSIRERRLSTRMEVERSKPFGIASYETRSGLRTIQLRALPATTKP
jgi:hypothetical protein